MEGEGPERGDVVCCEEEPLLHPRPATYLHFRVGREQKHASIYARFAQAVFKFFFCSIGFWGHQAWNYIPRILFGVVCVYQVIYEFSPITHPEMTANPQRGDLRTRKLFYGLLSVAAIASYLAFIGCFMAAKRKDSALVCPSQSMVDAHCVTAVHLLFVAFLFIYTMSSWTALFYKMENIDTATSAIGVVAICLAHWASVNTCNIFAISSFALGELNLAGYRIS